MKRASSAIAAIAALLGVAACAQTPAAGDHPPIVGAWDVTAIDGDAVPEGAPVNAAFSADGKVSGVSGCNHFGGDYAYRNGVVTISQTYMTEMACVDEGRMALEARFHNRFSGALSVKLAPDGSLQLDDDEGGLVLRRAPS